ncbi:MAG: winged helix-turn-helix domain-containing protein [Nitrosotalea sp.]
MSSQKYRTEIEIISEIFEIIMNAGIQGEYITIIVRNTNLSHNVALGKINKLIKAGLIRVSEEKKNKVFIITEEGIKFYRELRDFGDLIEEIRVKTLK